MIHSSTGRESVARRFLLSSLVLAFLAASAYAVPLQSLIDSNGVIVEGDKLFYNFDVVVTGIGTYAADPSQIEVNGITVGNDYGLRFDTATGAPILSADPDSFVDVLLSFDVAVLDPLYGIAEIDLAFAGFAPAEGFAQVVETARSALAVVAQTSVQVPGGPTSVTVPLPELYSTLHIIKDMVAVGGLTEGSYITWVEQLFPQEIPEPATLSFLALGALVLLRPRKLARMATKASVPAIVVLLTVSMLAAPGRVHAVPLQQVIDEGQSILVVDKLFENFSFSVAGAGAYIANPAAIDVAAISIGDEIGIRFAGLLAARSNLVPDSAVAVTIGYDVTVVDPNLWIHDISLFFNGMVTDPAGYARVAETVYYENTPVGSASVTTPSPLNDHDLFDAAFKKLHVEKTIELYGGARGFTTISFIDQTFSQIPEPATVALLGLALPLLRLRRRVK